MTKEAVVTMKIEPELRGAFMGGSRRPASQLVREMM